MRYDSLRDFIDYLEEIGELKRISYPVSADQEVTEICDRLLKSKGPAVLFENIKGSEFPLLGNLFGTPKRVALGMGGESIDDLKKILL